jgi:hypothetical protein
MASDARTVMAQQLAPARRFWDAAKTGQPQNRLDMPDGFERQCRVVGVPCLRTPSQYFRLIDLTVETA